MNSKQIVEQAAGQTLPSYIAAVGTRSRDLITLEHCNTRVVAGHYIPSRQEWQTRQGVPTACETVMAACRSIAR